mgnify:FL=1
MKDSKKIIEYIGNDEEFEKYDKIIEKKIKKMTIINYANGIQKYNGNIKKGLYEGRGILFNEEGKMIYNGFFKEGKYEGYGMKYEDNKLIYKGFFLDGKYNGKGTLYKNGLKIYEGYFSEGKYNGVGIFYVNGEKVSKRLYKDDYSLEEGYIIIYENNKEIYSGEISHNNPKEGKNITIYDSQGNKIYKGDFMNFNYHGEGVLYFKYSNDKYYSGKFEMNNYIEGKLYDLEGKITYEGKFINNIPIEGKNIKIFNLNKSLEYEGDLVNCKYNGKGKLYKNRYLFYDGEFKDGLFNGFGKIYNEKIIYYEGNFINNEIIGKGIKYYKNGKKHIQGDFEFKNKNEIFDFKFSKYYAKGILYDLNENKLCETEIIDFIPKEGKNIKLYNKDEILIYEGDFFDYKYQGKGKLYEKEETYTNNENNIFKLKYEGEFRQNIFEGYGKLYKNTYEFVYYEGNFCHGEIKGKGIRYYKNGKKKLEGIFEENNIFEGNYYNPKGEIIFKGKIINNIFYNYNYYEIYNDLGILLFKNEVETIKNFVGYYNDINILNKMILCRENNLNDNYISMNLNINKTISKISFISEGYAGKTSLIKRLIDNKFYEKLVPNMGPDFSKYEYIYNDIKYTMAIWNLHGNKRFYNINKAYFKDSNIIIYVIDASLSDNKINELFINSLFEDCHKNLKIIYLVLTKIDISEIDLKEFRKIAQKLILEGLIYRYFELSSNTGEGFESFRECLKFDSDFSLKFESKKKSGT